MFDVVLVIAVLIALIGLTYGLRGQMGGDSLWYAGLAALCFVGGLFLAPDMLTLVRASNPWAQVRAIVGGVLMLWGILATPYNLAGFIGWGLRRVAMAFKPSETAQPV